DPSFIGLWTDENGYVGTETAADADRDASEQAKQGRSIGSACAHSVLVGCAGLLPRDKTTPRTVPCPKVFRGPVRTTPRVAKPSLKNRRAVGLDDQWAPIKNFKSNLGSARRREAKDIPPHSTSPSSAIPHTMSLHQRELRIARR